MRSKELRFSENLSGENVHLVHNLIAYIPAGISAATLIKGTLRDPSNQYVPLHGPVNP